MKTTTLVPYSVDAELRKAEESLQREGETFIARGLGSSEDARRTGVYYSAADVQGELQRRLDARRKQVLGYIAGWLVGATELAS